MQNPVEPLAASTAPENLRGMRLFRVLLLLSGVLYVLIGIALGKAFTALFQEYLSTADTFGPWFKNLSRDDRHGVLGLVAPGSHRHGDVHGWPFSGSQRGSLRHAGGRELWVNLPAPSAKAPMAERGCAS